MAVALPLLSALSHAHGFGIVHRDVKPDNVFLALEPDGQVFPKLVDFGISQLRGWGGSSRMQGIVVGTPSYMSPEQARGEEVDARCDVFGIGLLLYECLSGSNPFGSEASTISACHSWPPAPIRGVPARLWGVICRALAEKPEDRFSSAADLAAGLSTATSGPGWRSSWSRGLRVRVALGVAMALVAAVFIYQPGARAANERAPGNVPVAAHAAKRVAAERDLLDVAPAAPTTPPRVERTKLPVERGRCPDLSRDPGF
jgi:serine/threonine protein kinase